MARFFVAYVRVSTGGQERSGLGLEAQQAAIAAFLQPGDRLLPPPFVEVESGRNSARPKLREALARCRQTGATLLISRLDRLARSVRFIADLMEERIPFVACDMPNATPFMLHVYAAVAEEEARAIAERTRAALARAKARGTALGGWRGGPKVDPALGRAAATARAGAFAASLASLVTELRRDGLSLNAVARELVERGIRTPRGGTRWTATSVSNLLARLTH